MDSAEPDSKDLIDFIETITNRKEGNRKIEGVRTMVDLCEVYKSYYYDPQTKGSNSIKAVLPALLKRSTYLQNKYAQPISQIGLNSKNFGAEHIWLQVKDGQIQDPYKTLPPVFEEWSNDELDQLSDVEDLNNGGAALTAYGFMQYSDMSEEERLQLAKALKRYCELDTLAMVMLYEHFVEVARC
jgi:hypothetical protein